MINVDFYDTNGALLGVICLPAVPEIGSAIKFAMIEDTYFVASVTYQLTRPTINNAELDTAPNKAKAIDMLRSNCDATARVELEKATS